MMQLRNYPPDHPWYVENVTMARLQYHPQDRWAWRYHVVSPCLRQLAMAICRLQEPECTVPKRLMTFGNSCPMRRMEDNKVSDEQEAPAHVPCLYNVVETLIDILQDQCSILE